MVLKNYIYGREQRVVSDEIHSDARLIRHGVLQGSCLSSLLFLIYMNDIFEVKFKGYVQLYADDIIMIYTCNGVEEMFENMKTDLDALNVWLYDNMLTMNARKTKYMIFSTGTSEPLTFPRFRLNNMEIERTTEVRYLGLLIDQQLKFNLHVNKVKILIGPILATLKYARYLIPSQTKLSMYYAYVQSHLQYLISVWGYSANTRLRPLQMMQNKAIRRIFWDEYNQDGTDTEALFQRHGILNIRQLLKYDSLLLIFKIKHEMIKTGLTFQVFSEVHSYETRNRNNFVLPRIRTNMLSNSLISKGLR